MGRCGWRNENGVETVYVGQAMAELAFCSGCEWQVRPGAKPMLFTAARLRAVRHAAKTGHRASVLAIKRYTYGPERIPVQTPEEQVAHARKLLAERGFTSESS